MRGRHEWKLTGVEKISREFCVSPPVRLRKLGKVSRLLQRLIHGEEQVAMLLHIVTQGFKALTEAERSEDAEVLEYVLVLRILAHLGYLAYTPELAPFAQPPPEGGTCTAEVFEEVRLNRTKYIRIINESLSATGL